MNKAGIATLTGLSAAALVIGGSITAVANGWNPLNVQHVVAEGVVASADDPGTSELDHGAAIASAQADKAARDAAAAAAALAAQHAADAVAAQAAQQAAADALAAQQAPDDATTDDAPAAASGPVKCPAGSTANSGDGPNDTSCFPDECFHVSLPDPAYPQCVTAFKP